MSSFIRLPKTKFSTCYQIVQILVLLENLLFEFPLNFCCKENINSYAALRTPISISLPNWRVPTTKSNGTSHSSKNMYEPVCTNMKLLFIMHSLSDQFLKLKINMVWHFLKIFMLISKPQNVGILTDNIDINIIIRIHTHTHESTVINPCAYKNMSKYVVLAHVCVSKIMFMNCHLNDHLT